MNSRDKARAAGLKTAIESFNNNIELLPGLVGHGHTDSLVEQIIDSLRRVEFAHHIRDVATNPSRADPASDIFDPLRDAVFHNRSGNIDEAWWLVFLATHFGKHASDGWQLSKNIYGKLGHTGSWDWQTISANPYAFTKWLSVNQVHFELGKGGRFSNHRRYESLKVSARHGTAEILSSYVNWLKPFGTHALMIRQVQSEVGQNPELVFDYLYGSMNSVSRFGRLGRFDFLCMLGKLGIAPIEPGSAFLPGATGPLRGARLLFGGHKTADISAESLNQKLIAFGHSVGVGMQVLEDSLCNWQKSPEIYKAFRG